MFVYHPPWRKQRVKQMQTNSQATEWSFHWPHSTHANGIRFENTTVISPTKVRSSQRFIGHTRNILAIIGAIFLLAVVIAFPIAVHVWSQTQGFDSRAVTVYSNLAGGLLQSGNPAEATAWKFPVADGLSRSDVEQIMESVASEHNLKKTGETILFKEEDRKEVETLTGAPYRYVKTLMFCNALTAAKMFNHNIAYSAYTPCRITLIEDDSGRLWLYSLNFDMMIYGGRTLPDNLKQEALKVRDALLDIMQRGASGEF